MAEDADQATPPSDAPVAVFEDILRSVPLLFERTVRQAGLVRTAAAHLPCVASVFPRRLEPSDPGTVMPEQLGVLDLFAGDATRPGESEPGDGAPVALALVAPAPVPVPVADDASAEETASPNGSVPLESELAVPDYDSLAASQVVPRLAMLSAEDLRAVLAYEQGHRHRQTILNRVSQLLEA